MSSQNLLWQWILNKELMANGNRLVVTSVTEHQVDFIVYGPQACQGVITTRGHDDHRVIHRQYNLIRSIQNVKNFIGKHPNTKQALAYRKMLDELQEKLLEYRK